MKFTRNRVCGLIGTFWGGAVTFSSAISLLADHAEQESGTLYGSGQLTGAVLGVLMLVVGLYFAIKG